MLAFNLQPLPLPPYQEEPQLFSINEHLELMRYAFVATESLNELNMLRKVIPTDLTSVFKLTESVQSTRIEGTQTTLDEVMEAEAVQREGNVDVQEVLNYQKALDLGINIAIRNDYPLSTSLLKDIHKEILYRARGASRNPGEFRTNQNWIGSETGGIENAQYVPPIAARVPELMGNLDKFINETNDKFHPLIMAGIIHAQFESIHPFLDGNGRVGRLLISLFLLKEKVCGDHIVFVSEELERNKFKYYSLLNNLRTEQPRWFDWLAFFLKSISNQAQNEIFKAKKIFHLLDFYTKNKTIMESMNGYKILLQVFSNPVFTAKNIQQELNISNATVNKWLKYFVEKGIIYPNNKKRGIVYRNYELMDILNH
ncbi:MULTISPECIES: Fic family protein [unclassified Snodgrassella]|uniref:Fic family protein n=1 Tax=unclassified Snodgrassella TaxID=2625236 RepID=UPI0018DCDC68|nr:MULTISPECIES: Fic family protein [unclassified Snodgrassella]MBI0159380.1 Fic family protein [Snodgrassella sp. W6238H11]MBI0161452.1 Fic family protein [Snodgrassella sp. W6238H14]